MKLGTMRILAAGVAILGAAASLAGAALGDKLLDQKITDAVSTAVAKKE
jgi:hypothetical protein